MEDLRMLIRMKSIKMWKIAEVIGVSVSQLYVWMRKYDEEHHKKILDAINSIERNEE